MKTLIKYFGLLLLSMPVAYGMEPDSIKTSENSQEQECQICYNMEPVLAECVHCHQAFCGDCAIRWIGNVFTYTTNYQDPNEIHEWPVVNKSCPYCRHEISTEELKQMFKELRQKVFVPLVKSYIKILDGKTMINLQEIRFIDGNEEIIDAVKFDDTIVLNLDIGALAEALKVNNTLHTLVLDLDLMRENLKDYSGLEKRLRAQAAIDQENSVCDHVKNIFKVNNTLKTVQLLKCSKMFKTYLNVNNELTICEKVESKVKGAPIDQILYAAESAYEKLHNLKEKVQNSPKVLELLDLIATDRNRIEWIVKGYKWALESVQGSALKKIEKNALDSMSGWDKAIKDIEKLYEVSLLASK